MNRRARELFRVIPRAPCIPWLFQANHGKHGVHGRHGHADEVEKLALKRIEGFN